MLGGLKFLGQVYAAEALVQLGCMPEALQHLNAESVTDIITSIPTAREHAHFIHYPYTIYGMWVVTFVTLVSGPQHSDHTETSQFDRPAWRPTCELSASAVHCTLPYSSSPLFYTYSCLVGAKCSPVSEQCGWCTCSDALQPGQHLLSAEGGGESQEGAAAGSWLVLMAGVPLNSLIAYLQAATLFGEIPSQVVLLSAYIELMSGEHTGW